MSEKNSTFVPNKYKVSAGVDESRQQQQTGQEYNCPVLPDGLSDGGVPVHIASRSAYVGHSGLWRHVKLTEQQPDDLHPAFHHSCLGEGRARIPERCLFGQYQHTCTHGFVCPASWRDGGAVVCSDAAGLPA